MIETACAPYGESSLWAPRSATGCAVAARARPRGRRPTTSARSSSSTRTTLVAGTRRRTARGAARRHRLRVRSPVRARSARRRDRDRPGHERHHRHDAAPRPDAHDGAVGRQPAVGRPDRARPRRRRRAVAGRPAVPARHEPAPGRGPGVAAGSARPPARAARAAVAAQPADATALVRAVIEREPDGCASTTTAIAELVDRGGGNPLFLIEMAALAAIVPVAVRSCPGSLRALIAARLDGLPPSRRADHRQRRRARADAARRRRSTTSPRRWARSSSTTISPSSPADGLLDVDGHWWRFHSDVVREVAYQTLHEAHAGAAARRRRDRARHREGAPRSRTSPTTPPRRPSWSPSSATSRACRGRSASAPCKRCSGVPRGDGVGRVREHAIQHAGRALDLRAPRPPTNGSCC